MNFITSELLLIWTFELSLAAIMSLVVAWIVIGQTHIVLKASVLAMLLVPVGVATMHDYVLIQLIHLSAVSIAISSLSFVAQIWRRDEASTATRVQFSLRWLLLAMAVIGLVTLELRFVLERQLDLTKVLLEGALDACVTLFSLILVWSPLHWGIRFAIFLSGAVCTVIGFSLTPLAFYLLLYTLSSFTADATEIAPYIVAQLIVVCGASALARFATRQRQILFATGESTPRMTARILPLRLIASVLLLLVICPGGYLWIHMALTSRVTAEVQGPESAYVQIVAAAKQLNWQDIPNQDYDLAIPEQLGAFVKRNAPVIANVRRQIGPNLHAAVDYNTLSMSELQELRNACRAFRATAMHYEATGNRSEAARIDSDCIGLGVYVGRGGLITDSLVGIAIASVGTAATFEAIPELNSPTCGEVLRKVQRFQESVEPWDDLLVRDRRWEQTGYGWHGQAYVLAREILYLERHELFWQAAARSETELALLETHLAIRTYELAHGELPDSLNKLIPGLLAEQPVDGFSHVPLKFRRDGGTYVLYSCGINGVDDGGTMDITSTLPSAQPDYRLEYFKLAEEKAKADEAAEAAAARRATAGERLEDEL